MKGSFNLKKTLGQKNIILAVVALVLIVMTVIGSTFSWIEEVSHVEFNSTDGQKTPAHIGAKILKSDAAINEKNAASTINLNEYFLKSGDAHLSPCYSNGEDFYFPVEKITTGGTTSFRSGTKDDANVSYMSATFRVRSEGMGCVFWFEKSKDNNSDVDYITCEKTDDDDVTTSVNLNKYLRVSVSVDGATNVYALDTNGKFKTIEGNDPPAPVEKTARRIDQYTYYDEKITNELPDATVNNAKPNQGSKDGEYNLNGNTVFSVPKYDDSSTESKTNTTKTVNIKLWLEYDAQNNATRVDVSKLNLNLVSSWTKTRRIYVLDKTESESSHNNNGKWLFDSGAKVFWKSYDLSKSKEVTSNKYGTVSSYKGYYIEIPAVYNNYHVILFRCDSQSTGTQYFGSQGYWDMWETYFPDTYHSETYTIYTSKFGTWEDSANKVYYLNSCRFDTPKAYMWDNSYGDMNNGVVFNKAWPGDDLTKLNQNRYNFDFYTFYFGSEYSNIIFSNGLAHGGNWEHQTQDINNVRNREGKTFDMTTLMWYDATPSSPNNLPTYANYSNNFIRTTLTTSNNSKDTWTNLYLCYNGTPIDNNDKAKFNGTDSNNLFCRAYTRYGAAYDNNLQLVLCINGTYYKCKENDDTLSVYGEGGHTKRLHPADDTYNKNLYLTNVAGNSVYSIYVKRKYDNDSYGNGYDVTLHKD